MRSDEVHASAFVPHRVCPALVRLVSQDHAPESVHVIILFVPKTYNGVNSLPPSYMDAVARSHITDDILCSQLPEAHYDPAMQQERTSNED